MDIPGELLPLSTLPHAADYHSVVYIHTVHNTTRSLIDVVNQPHPGCVNHPQYQESCQYECACKEKLSL